MKETQVELSKKTQENKEKSKTKIKNNMYLNNKHGITLIALAVTIVVMLILAGITIQTAIGDGGIINLANEAKEQQIIASYKDRIGIVGVNWSLNRALDDSVTVNDLWQDMQDAKIINNKETDVEKVDENGNYIITVPEGYKFQIHINEYDDVEIDYIGKEDNLLPYINEIKVINQTSNSVELQVTVSRLNNGTLNYYYKEKDAPDEDYQLVKGDTTDLTAIITGLNNKTTYEIKVEATNENGTTEKVTEVFIGELKGSITQKGETVWSNGTATIHLETEAQNLSILYQINSIEGTYQPYDDTKGITGLGHGDTVFAVLSDGTNITDYTSIDVLDKLGPTVTVTQGSKSTNNIQVSVNSSDAEWGMPDSITYNYYIKKTADGNYPQNPTHTGTETSYTFTGLIQNTSYDVKVTTNDKAGNPGEGQVTNITTDTVGGADDDLKDGNIIASDPTWSNGTASITLSKGTGVASHLTIQYQVGDIAEGKWTTAQEGAASVTVTGLSHNNVVYARLTDGTNYGSYASVDILDKLGPTVTVTQGSKNTNNIQVSASSSDAEWGMPDSITYNYYIKQSSAGSYPTDPTHTGTETSYTFTGLIQNTSYDVKVTTSDKAGNLGEGQATNITTDTVGGADDDLKDGNIIASDPTWSNGSASITLSKGTGVASHLTIQYQVGDIAEGNWTTVQAGAASVTVTGLTHNSIVYARLTDGTNYGSYASVDILDKLGPAVTVTQGTKNTNSIQVSVNSSDAEWGMPDSVTYNYYIKQTSEGSYPTDPTHTGTETSYTFTGLIQNTSYDVKVTTSDKAGNPGEGQATNITTDTVGGAGDDLKEGNIIASEPTWSNGSASITLSKGTEVASNFTIQYQVGDIAESNWTTAQEGAASVTVTGLSHNNIVYARLTDGTNYGSYASVTILDKISPQSARINLSTNTTKEKETITATVTHTDNESGVNITNCKWVYNTTSTPIGTEEGSYTGGNFSSNGETINLTASTAGIYYLHVLTVDMGGNKVESISNAITVEKKIVADGSFSEEKGVNTPDLANGKLTPVKWVNNKLKTTTIDDPDWYDYSTTAKKWANAQTADGSIWVWIPRYAYQINTLYHSSSTKGGEINIKFMKGTSNEAADGTTTWQNKSGQGNWNVHPGFEYSNTVSGLWVAKFEASRNNATSSSEGSGNTIKIQPGVRSWIDISVKDIYNTCLDYNSSLNSHMMKNSEWGAVAYLAQSNYGKNEEVWINPNDRFLTGQAGTGPSVGRTTSTDEYNSGNGPQASTTGNIYGVYDMSGGSLEYVAAYVDNGNDNLNTYGSSLIKGASYTKDVYIRGGSTSGEDSGQTNYSANSSRYGDAVYETTSTYYDTNSWYGDYLEFPYYNSPFFLRGGDRSNGSGAGIFSFRRYTGKEQYSSGFRPVLVAF